MPLDEVHSKCLIGNQTGVKLSIGGLIAVGHAFGQKKIERAA